MVFGWFLIIINGPKLLLIILPMREIPIITVLNIKLLSIFIYSSSTNFYIQTRKLRL